MHAIIHNFISFCKIFKRFLINNFIFRIQHYYQAGLYHYNAENYNLFLSHSIKGYLKKRNIVINYPDLNDSPKFLTFSNLNMVFTSFLCAMFLILIFNFRLCSVSKSRKKKKCKRLFTRAALM